ncbi:BspA family leucine-rich repeat surface protein [Mycoplasma capricolum]|uniref:BspA family leucine-rich repeat surface protein n=1 Tax=Mycoplasma capricolum TaxID=2095 RepID=UPI003DA63405
MVQLKHLTNPLNTWDVSNVKNMRYMFKGATSFDKPIDNWNTSNVTNMGYMFFGATSFNQDLSKWNTSNVISEYNQNIGYVNPNWKSENQLNLINWKNISRYINLYTLIYLERN